MKAKERMATMFLKKMVLFMLYPEAKMMGGRMKMKNVSWLNNTSLLSSLTAPRLSTATPTKTPNKMATLLSWMMVRLDSRMA